jgi:hypothetical protein
MMDLPVQIAWVIIPIETVVVVSEPVAMQAAIRSAAQMNTADVGPIKVYPTETTNVGTTGTTNMSATEMGPADMATTEAADVAAADAANMATTEGANVATAETTTAEATTKVGTTEAATAEAATPASSEGSRRDCGAAQKEGGDCGHHHFSHHQSLHSYIVRSTISYSAEHRSSLRLSRQCVQPLRVSLQYLVVDLPDCFGVIAPGCPGLRLSARPRYR